MANDSPGYKKRAKKSGEQRKEKPNIVLKEDDNCLRVLPTPAGKTSPDTFMEYQVHQNVGPKKAYLRCGHPPGWKKGDDDSEDYICDEVIPKLKKKGKLSRADALAPETRLVVQASIVSEDDDGNTKFGPAKPWQPSGKTAGSLLTSILGSKSRDYVHPKRGYNININRTGTGFKDTRYGAIEPDDDPSRVPKSIIADLKPFDQIRGIPTYNAKAQKAALLGQDFDWKAATEDSESASSDSSDEAESGVDDVFDSESDSSDKPKKGKNKMAVKKANKKSKKETESDEEEEESETPSESETDSEEESEEESKEKKSSKKKKKKETESEEDSSEESSEEDSSEESSEEESEEPKKKPAKKAIPKKKAKKK
jgi:hypothetical protein